MHQQIQTVRVNNDYKGNYSESEILCVGYEWDILTPLFLFSMSLLQLKQMLNTMLKLLIVVSKPL